MNPSIQFPSPIGPITLTASQVGIRTVQFLKSENDLAFSINTLLVTAQTQILAYLTGTRKSFSLELDLTEYSWISTGCTGGDQRHHVWRDTHLRSGG